MKPLLSLTLFLAGCGCIADVPRDASPDRADVETPCAPITDTGKNVTTEYVDGTPPALVPYDGMPALGLYMMTERRIYGSATDPSIILRKSIELLPNAVVTSMRIDEALDTHRVRYESESGVLENGARLRTVCGETETFTFELVPLQKTRIALVGRRGQKTVIEVYDPPPPL